MDKINKGAKSFSHNAIIEKSKTILKSLVLAFLISISCIIIYAIILSLTPLSDNTMSIVTQAITILSITVAGINSGNSIKKKGWLYGLIIGFLYVIILIPLGMLWGNTPVFDKYLISKIFMGSAVGFIGGIIGVNLK